MLSQVTAKNIRDVFSRHCVLYFVVRVRCRRKESSHSLSNLLMSFLSSRISDQKLCQHLFHL